MEWGFQGARDFKGPGSLNSGSCVDQRTRIQRTWPLEIRRAEFNEPGPLKCSDHQGFPAGLRMTNVLQGIREFLQGSRLDPVAEPRLELIPAPRDQPELRPVLQNRDVVTL